MRKHKALADLLRCAVFAALLCICSPITIPVGVIPFTLGIFAVMLAGVVLGMKAGLLSVITYLALGLFLPVFSGGNTALTALPGPTGGYIWSYLLMIPVICLIGRIWADRPVLACLTAFLGCTAALALCYLCGTLQFSRYSGTSFRRSLTVCVVPFILPDLAKAAAAALLGVSLRRVLVRAGLQE